MLSPSQPNRIERACISIRARPDLEVYRAVLDRLDTPIFLLGLDRDRQALIYVNRAFERWAGCAAETAPGQEWHTLCRIVAGDPGLAQLHSCLSDGRSGQALVRTGPLGEQPGWAQVCVSPMPADDGREWFIVQLRDVTAETHEREHLRREALHDALTGLPNRRLLQIRLEQAITRAHDGCRPFALVFLDLDRFKQVNDTLGHEAADQLLRQIARRLRHGVRAQDTVARLYGDEFALLLTPLPSEQSAEAISHRVAAWLQQPFVINDLRIEVTCSVGVVLYPDGTDGRHLLDSADRDMYRRKRVRQERPAADGVGACASRVREESMTPAPRD